MTWPGTVILQLPPASLLELCMQADCDAGKMQLSKHPADPSGSRGPSADCHMHEDWLVHKAFSIDCVHAAVAWTQELTPAWNGQMHHLQCLTVSDQIFGLQL